jgi:hypothetical protein
MDTRKANAAETKRRAGKKPWRVAGFIQAWKYLVKKDKRGAAYRSTAPWGSEATGTSPSLEGD